MVAGGPWLQRVIQYVANELIVDRLANSPTFQRFAVRSNKKLQELAQKGVAQRQSLMEQVKEFSEQLKQGAAGSGGRS
ncbi:unnamed protein product [Closterium sp. Naga37s-1]|nr:unnamed protein product [Closterium sp. Yama58-4]CAI5486737.1 unnamed protein product [Closterium sp. Naga37s-1]CAI5982499.1 unnamed protein product [Closterium sp. NIES-65]